MNRDDAFLSSVRNAFILLIVGLTLYEFGGRLSKMAVVVFILVALLVGSALYNYWTNSEPSNLGLVPWIILAALAVVVWLIYEAWTNPRQLFEMKTDRLL